jgi:hypothetical protein
MGVSSDFEFDWPGFQGVGVLASLADEEVPERELSIGIAVRRRPSHGDSPIKESMSA